MKRILLLLLLTGCIIFSGCYQSAKLKVEADNQSLLSVNTNKAANNSNTQTFQTDDSALKSKYPIVFSGAVFLDNQKITTSKSVWVIVNTDILEKLDSEETFSKYENTSIKVDIMNCAGYLGSGIAQYDSGRGTGWKIQEILPETEAADSSEKIKQCSGKNVSEDESFIMGNAFAVESQTDERSNIKISEVDTRRLFASLPEDIRNWLNDKSNLGESGTREKDNLSSSSHDNWTDIDGDGEIDLIEVSANCGKYECGAILYLVKGKWIKIGSWIPA